METMKLLIQARELATQAHRGQVDKTGHPYIEHPARVATRVQQLAPGDDDAETVAWLHDVVEDTSVTLHEIELRFGPRIAAAVQAITRRPGENPDDYYRRVAQNPLALTVKHADIADNTDPARTSQLDPATRDRLAAKYEHARARLAAEVTAPGSVSV